jgi:hypothetical protein
MHLDLLPADPKYRRRLFLGYALGLLAVVAVPLLFGPLLVEWIRLQEPRVQVLLADSIAITFLLGFLPPSLYIIRTGRRAVAENQYPHSGMRMIFDTPVHRGVAALRRGKTLVRLGMTGVVAIVLGSLAVHFICYKFLTDPFFFIRA